MNQKIDEDLITAIEIRSCSPLDSVGSRAADTIERLVKDKKDAERYRKMRRIGVDSGLLVATSIALDLAYDNKEFDAIVDSNQEPT